MQEAPSPSSASDRLDRSLPLELVRVTEAAALAAHRWIGRGDKEAADQAAVDAMRAVLDTIAVDGEVIIGEGEKDEAPMLHNGERVGSGGPRVDIAVDPLEGTTLVACAQPGAVAVIALAQAGSMLFPGCVYMEKLVCGPAAAGVVDIEVGVTENARRVAKATGKDLRELTVVVLDRGRNRRFIEPLRDLGVCVRLVNHGDVAPAIEVARGAAGAADMLVGIGGSPEGLIAAAAVRCMGGTIQARLWPRGADEATALAAIGQTREKVLATRDLLASDDVIVAVTGVTDGMLLAGVQHAAGGATTESLVMRSRTGTVRKLQTSHAVREAVAAG
jgi:fructose-1,6-bisphosphatase II